MILPDSSAWIEMFRATGHPVDRRLAGLIDEDADVALTEPVVMEVLAGTGPPLVEQARAALLAFPLLRVHGLEDYERAADVYRSCRLGGSTPRGLVDCLIAAVAIREGASVLHNDADFDVIARHTSLRIEPAG